MKRIDSTSVGEEIFNSVTHGVAALMSIGGSIFLITQSYIDNDIKKVVGYSIFGFTLFILYLFSTLYHSLKFTRAKNLFRILDHCSIYLLIAGTYTPIILTILSGWPSVFALTGIWTLCLVGIILKSLFINRFQILSVLTYIMLGWLSIVLVNTASGQLPNIALKLMIIGGLSYTVGTIFYAWKKLPYNHGIWHFFVIGGSLAHFAAMLNL